MIKYIGIFILASSLSVYGAVLSASLKSANNLRKEIILLLKSVESGIKYGSLPIKAIIQNSRFPLIEKSGFYSAFTENGTAESAVSIAFTSLTEKDRDMLCTFFSRIGKSAYAEHELNLCRYYIDYFEKTQSENEKDITSKIYLYKKIGLLAGILSAIIFI